MRELLAQQVASGGVNFIDEVAEDPHFKYRGTWTRSRPALRQGPLRHDPLPGAQDSRPREWIGRPVGYDNGEVYLKLLGFGRDKLAKLKKRGVV